MEIQKAKNALLPNNLSKAAAILMMRRSSTSGTHITRSNSQGVESLQLQTLTEEELVYYRQQFTKLIIPDEELSDTSVNVLNQTIFQLNSMVKDIRVKLDEGAGLLDSSKTLNLDSKIKSKGLELVEDILKEIALYSEFITGVLLGDELNLDNILQSEIDKTETFSVTSPFASESTSLRGALSPLSPYGRYEETVPLTLFEEDNEALKTLLKAHAIEEEPEDGLLQWVSLISISRQVYSEQVKGIAGYPTSLAVSRSIVIGTSRGLILVFDYNQNLKGMFGNSAMSLEHGSIISLTISADGTWVVAGFDKGLILVWDLKSGKMVSNIFPVSVGTSSLLQTASLNSGHIKGCQIRHVKFIGKTKRFVSSDDFGFVFIHSITQTIVGTRRKTKKVYSGEISAKDKNPNIPLEKLLAVFSLEALPYSNVQHYLDASGLLAIVTPHTLTILCTQPKPEILFTMQRLHTESGVEAEFGKPQADFYQFGLAACSAWFPSIREGEELSDPLLAVSWGNYLTILRVCSSNAITTQRNGSNSKFQNHLEVFKVGESICDFCIVSLSWINQRNLILVDHREILHLFDIQSLNSPTTMGSLIKHTPLTTSVNPMSKHSAVVSVKSIDIMPSYCYSIQASKGRLYVLSTNHVGLGVTLTWSEHVMNLIFKGSAVEAILLATQYLREGSVFFFSRLPEDDYERKEIIKVHLEDLIVASLNVLPERIIELEAVSPQPDINPLKLAHACIEACLEMDKFELLFSLVYSSFKEKNKLYYFFSGLKSKILNPTPSTIDMIDQLPPDLLKDLISTFASNPDLISDLDRVIFHLNPTFLDLDFTIEICRRHMLIDILMYIWSNSLSDFITPVIEIWKIWKDPSWNHRWNAEATLKPLDTCNAIKTPTSPLEIPKEKTLVAKLFCYLLEVSSGKVFPTRMSLSQVGINLACSQLVELISSPGLLRWPEGASYIETPIFNGESFPYFKFLIEHELEKTIALFNNLQNTILKYSLEPKLLQKLVDPCINALSNEKNLQQLISIGLFLAQLYSTNKISLSTECLDSLIELLTDPNQIDKDNSEKYQEGVSLLLEHHVPSFPDICKKLETVKFYKPLKLIFHKKNDFMNEISTCFKHPSLVKEVFSILQFDKKSLDSQLVSEITFIILKNISLLVRNNPRSTINLVSQWIEVSHESIVSSLDKDPKAQYDYLNALYLSQFLESNRNLLFLFICLQCKYQPSDVYSILNDLKRKNISIPYDEVLKATKEFDVTDATVWIFEQNLAFSNAMSEILLVLEKRVDPILIYLRKLFTTEGDHTSLTSSNILDFIQSHLLRIRVIIDIAIQLCDRTHALHLREFPNSLQTDVTPPFSNECERLYYMLLNSVTGLHKSILFDAQCLLKNQIFSLSLSNINEMFRSSIERIFNSILHPKPQPGKTVTSELPRIVSMPRILVSIIGHTNPEKNDRASPAFGEFRDVIYGVLKTCKVEENWLHIASKLQSQDLFQLVDTRFRIRSRGQRGFAPRCLLCRSKLVSSGQSASNVNASSSKKIIMFTCGHLVHESCHSKPGSLNTDCPKCHKH